MTRRFDLIVVGTGVGGSTVAKKCRKAGWNVAVVDSRPYGGTCATRGCNPKKVLVSAAEVVDAVMRLNGKGVTGEVRIHWPDLIRFKQGFTDSVPESLEQEYANAGIQMFHGNARFVGATSLEIEGERIESRYIHLATGSRPATLSIRGAEHLTTSDQFLELETLPRHLIFLGSGYIAFEFAHVSATAGSMVTMLEAENRPLKEFDPDLASLLSERTRSMGVDLQVATTVEGIERDEDGLVVLARRGGSLDRLRTDMVVHSAGRVPNISDLDLGVAGVEHDASGIAVNEYMQSVSNPAVYAAGDATKGAPPLSPVGTFEAHVVVSNLLEGNHRKADYPPTPYVVFTLPPFASVGLQERDAKSAGLAFQTHYAQTADWSSSRRVGEKYSAYKVLVAEDTGLILGAHVFGPHADELINLFALAMRCNMSARDLKKTIFAYPTIGSDIVHML